MDTPQETLHEDKNYQSQCLEQFREWIQKDLKIKKCRTDDDFLLRFLRMKKFSVTKAFQLLVKYLTARKLVPHYFENLDLNDPDIDHLISNGLITILPQPDPQGSPIFLLQFDNFVNFVPKNSTAIHSARLVNLVFEIFSCDPRSQTFGVTAIVDCTHLTSEMLGNITLTIIKDCVMCWQKSITIRPHTAYIVNMPHFAKTIYNIIKSFLSEKVQNRHKIVSGWEAVRQELGAEVLPKEFGGKIPKEELIKAMKIKAWEHREEILALNDFDIQVDQKEVNFGSSKDSELDAAIVGSFRKLEVD